MSSIPATLSLFEAAYNQPWLKRSVSCRIWLLKWKHIQHLNESDAIVYTKTDLSLPDRKDIQVK